MAAGTARRASGTRARGSRSGFNTKVILKGEPGWLPIGEFRFCGVTRISAREFEIEDATAGP